MSLRLLFACSLGIVAGCASSTQLGDAASTTDGARTSDGSVAIDARIDDASIDDASIDDASVDDAGSQTDTGGSLTTCGGFGGLTCTASEYCQYGGPVACGAADGTGVCRARPTSCAPDTRAVCGCDRVDYANACEANRAGTDVASSGRCNGTMTFACGSSLQCTAGAQYCQITMGGPPPGHTSYACNPLPASCLALSALPSCANCFAGNAMCRDVGVAEMTVTLLTP